MAKNGIAASGNGGDSEGIPAAKRDVSDNITAPRARKPRRPSHAANPGRHPLSDRGQDLYETPAVAVEALLRVEQLPHHHAAGDLTFVGGTTEYQWSRIWSNACDRFEWRWLQVCIMCGSARCLPHKTIN
jgi:hypothetical protein